MTHHQKFRTALNLAVTLVAATAAQATVAAISLDLHLDPDKGIDANSVQFGVAVAITGTGTERTFKKPSFADIAWSQRMDTTYPSLLRNALTGDTIDEAKIRLLSAGANTPYLSLTANGVGVTGVSLANDSVNGSMNYGKLTMTYDPTGLGKRGNRISSSYDLTTFKTSGASSRAPTIYEGTRPASVGEETQIYLRLGSSTGRDAIAGEANAIGYENWIKLESAQMGVGMGFTAPGGGVEREPGKPSISDITVTHAFDAAVPALFGALVSGTELVQATIEYVTVNGAGPVTFMQLVLNDVRLTGLSLSSGGDLPSVSESLNFRSFSQTVWEIGSNGRRGNSTSVGYSMIDGKTTAGALATNVPGFGAGNLTGTLTASGAGSAPGVGAAPVPEPETWLMMAAGLGVLGVAARRRAIV